jgi:hypothetical protein
VRRKPVPGAIIFEQELSSFVAERSHANQKQQIFQAIILFADEKLSQVIGKAAEKG